MHLGNVMCCALACVIGLLDQPHLQHRLQAHEEGPVEPQAAPLPWFHQPQQWQLAIVPAAASGPSTTQAPGGC